MLVLIYKRLSNYLLITPFESSNTGAISANETRSLVALVLTVGLWPSFQSIFGSIEDSLFWKVKETEQDVGYVWQQIKSFDVKKIGEKDEQ